MTTQAGTIGHAPTISIKPIEPKRLTEQQKYEKLWGRAEKDYRTVAPGEHHAFEFLKQAQPEKDAEVIDFGCGTGRGALSLALFGGMRVKMLDFAENCLDPEVAEACVTQPTRISFKVQDLTLPIEDSAAYGYCCDVMEHIPTDMVRRVLANILGSANHVFFGISTVPDIMGETIGEELHLTVKPMAWWVEQLTDLGAVVHWSRSSSNACFVYCSAWQDAADVVKTGVINVSEAKIDEQVKQNILAGYKQVSPHDRQDREVVLLAGGPSMRSQIDKIRELRSAGAALVTVNGAYGWAIEQDLQPSVQIVLDARPFNARFVKPLVSTCRYLIASQCHPDTLAALPMDQVLLWHTGGISDENEALVTVNEAPFYPIPGGSTVVLRALPLLRMLGLTRFHMFGFDSCVAEDAHHAYAQAENDNQVTIPVTCGGRTFQCAPWQLSQASEFRDLVQFMGDEMELAVYGDGLIAHMLETGASFSSDTPQPKD